MNNIRVVGPAWPVRSIMSEVWMEIILSFLAILAGWSTQGIHAELLFVVEHVAYRVPQSAEAELDGGAVGDEFHDEFGHPVLHIGDGGFGKHEYRRVVFDDVVDLGDVDLEVVPSACGGETAIIPGLAQLYYIFMRACSLVYV